MNRAELLEIAKGPMGFKESMYRIPSKYEVVELRKDNARLQYERMA